MLASCSLAHAPLVANVQFVTCCVIMCVFTNVLEREANGGWAAMRMGMTVILIGMTVRCVSAMCLQ